MVCSCECGAKFSLYYTLLCKKGGFAAANLLKKICRDVSTEPKLQSFTGERFEETTALEIRVFNPTAKR